MHLVHPLGLHWDTRRVKNDMKDATELANRLRRNDLPGGVDRPTRSARAERTGPLPGQADRVADLGQSAGACGDGQAGHPARPVGHVRAGPASGSWTRWTSPALTGCGWSRCGTCWRCSTARSPWSNGRSMLAQRRPRLPGHPGNEWDRADHRGDPGGRDRRRAPLHLGPASVLVGGDDPQDARVRHQVPSGEHHQTGVDDRPLGGGRVGGPLPRRRSDRPDLPSDRGAARAR